MNHNYNRKLQPLAKQKKREMTKAEACIWKYALSKKQMLGFSFRRQRPIENFIVDFVCLELSLIIEVDGYSHELTEVQENDLKRQQVLENLGFIVMRFRDDEVLNKMSFVRDQIERQIELIKDK
jgi:very-short-patch-repair endonuclease